jgi:RNA polymerase sigma-70 factor, ECF subfamily
MKSYRSDSSLRLSSTEALVSMAQEGSQAALSELVQRYQKLVYVTLHQLAPERGDIADLAQEALLKMCRSIKTLRNPATFKFWLVRILTNIHYDELRKAPKQLQTVPLEHSPDAHANPADTLTYDIPDSKALPDRMALDTELDLHIQHAIEQLPEQFRTIIVLREVQGLSYEEIALLTQVNIGTVKSRLARARFRLQEQLKPYLQDSE